MFVDSLVRVVLVKHPVHDTDPGVNYNLWQACHLGRPPVHEVSEVTRFIGCVLFQNLHVHV